MTRTIRSLALLAVTATLAVACNPNGTPAPASNSAETAPSGASSAATGNCPTKQPPPLAAGEKRLVTLSTAKGDIAITIDADLSPIAAGNFVALAECGFYNGVGFHRIATLEDGTPFVIQGGDPSGDGTGGPGYTIKDEPVTTLYSRGTVAMARTPAPDSVGSQFFIVLDDKDRSILADANTYQIIGTVTTGMETVDAIYKAGAAEVNPASPVLMDKVSVSTP
jgi:cyclophilin family peptidyl-prolyl cis-trans isomerase